MRVAIAVICLAGCGGGAEGDSAGSAGKPPEARQDLPRVDDPGAVLVLANARPSALVWIDATGKLATGTPPAGWSGDIAPARDRHASDPAKVRGDVLAAIVAGKGPAANDAAFAQSIESAGHTLSDDPWATVADDPLLPGRGRIPGAPAVALDKLDRLGPLVIAAPSAPATAVVRTLAHTGGAVAVDFGGKLAVLDLGFAIAADTPQTGSAGWLELSADANGLHVVSEPDHAETIVAWTGSAIDTRKLAESITAVRDHAWIDVVVRDDTTAQTLADLLAAIAPLHEHVAVAAATGALADRKSQIAIARRSGGTPGTVTPMAANIKGDIVPEEVRETIDDQHAKLLGCYQKQLAVKPYLAGTVQAQIVIGADGKATASVDGVDADIASCFQLVLAAATYPLPVGGGQVIVHEAFVLEK